MHRESGKRLVVGLSTVAVLVGGSASTATVATAAPDPTPHPSSIATPTTPAHRLAGWQTVGQGSPITYKVPADFKYLGTTVSGISANGFADPLAIGFDAIKDSPCSNSNGWIRASVGFAVNKDGQLVTNKLTPAWAKQMSDQAYTVDGKTPQATVSKPISITAANHNATRIDVTEHLTAKTRCAPEQGATTFIQLGSKAGPIFTIVRDKGMPDSITDADVEAIINSMTTAAPTPAR